MSRFLSVTKFLVSVGAVILFVTLVAAEPVGAQANTRAAFTLLGPDGALARVITTDAQCPEITIDGNAAAMQVRAAPDEKFPVTVCDAAIPRETKNASVHGQALRLPTAKPARIVVLGDTGCRLKGDNVQSCNDPAQWPFARIADSAANAQPDLVIHVGDYHYRESPCIEGKADCVGSPFGDNWAAWDADLFTPARALLQAAPWVIVRGNHEDCQRAGNGYFRLLDPRPMPTNCPDYTDPYAIPYMEPQLVVVDDSFVNDYQIEPAQVDAYKKQFEQVNADAARATTWILLHDPMYAFGHAGEQDGKEQLFQDQPTLQQATNNQFPETVQSFISGHLHIFETLSFGQGRAPQLLVGNSGTKLDPPMTTPLKGLEIAGLQVEDGISIARFGYAAVFRTGDHWAIGVRDVNGNDMARCSLGGAKLVCRQPALPATGGEIVAPQFWLALALLGASIFLGGFALLYSKRTNTRVQVQDGIGNRQG